MAELPPPMQRGKLRALTEEQKGAVIHSALDMIYAGATLTEACELLGEHSNHVRKWIGTNEEWYFLYRAARLGQAQAMVDKALLIAERSTAKTVNRDRLEIDTLKWAASKMNPAEFGDRVDHQVSGESTVTFRIVEDSPTGLPESVQKRLKA